ncbi:hypothetical protein BGZ67_004411 [Mortierella alpina]|nr:hypothetical protein BGZ67_004411 [Mortierella alpina]
MKFTLVGALTLLLASVVAAQEGGNSTDGGGSACTLCLQNTLRALPLCKDINITIGEFNPGVSSEYAVCLCSSINGTWIDNCKGDTLCGPGIESFKSAYGSNLQQAGLQCNGTKPTFIPPPADPVAPTGPGAASPTKGAGGTSWGQSTAAPSALFMQFMGAVAVAAGVGASLL